MCEMAKHLGSILVGGGKRVVLQFQIDPDWVM